MKVDFKEGDEVKKGDLIAQIDPRPYEAALAQAKGTACARRSTARRAPRSISPATESLATQNAVPRQTLDTQIALVAQNQGTVEADRARGEVRRGQPRVLPHRVADQRPRRAAPGRSGQLRDAGRHQRPRRDHAARADQRAVHAAGRQSAGGQAKRLKEGAVLPTAAYDRSGINKLADGSLQTFDSQIDPTTGTIKLRAQFENDERTLYPNQFVNIRLLLDTHKDVTTMPTAGVQRGVPGTFVYLVNADSTVSVRAGQARRHRRRPCRGGLGPRARRPCRDRRRRQAARGRQGRGAQLAADAGKRRPARARGRASGAAKGEAGDSKAGAEPDKAGAGRHKHSEDGPKQ